MAIEGVLATEVIEVGNSMMVRMVPDTEQRSQALSTVESRLVFTELSRDCTAPNDFLSAKETNNAMKELNSWISMSRRKRVAG